MLVSQFRPARRIIPDRHDTVPACTVYDLRLQFGATRRVPLRGNMTPPQRLPQSRSFKSLTVRAFATVATFSLLIAVAAAPAQAQYAAQYAQGPQPPYPQSQYQPNPYAGQYTQPQAYAQPSYAQPSYAQPS